MNKKDIQSTDPLAIEETKDFLDDIERISTAFIFSILRRMFPDDYELYVNDQMQFAQTANQHSDYKGYMEALQKFQEEQLNKFIEAHDCKELYEELKKQVTNLFSLFSKELIGSNAS